MIFFTLWTDLAHEYAAHWIDATLAYSALVNDTPYAARKR